MKNKDSEDTIQDCINKELSLPPLAAEILSWLRRQKRMTVKDLACYTSKRRSTLKLRLRELIRDGYVQKHGRGKATWYTLGGKISGYTL